VPLRVNSGELPVSASSAYKARRESKSATRAAQPVLFALSINNVKPSPPLACHRTVASADVREPAAPTPMLSTMDSRGSSSVATSGLRFKVQYSEHERSNTGKILSVRNIFIKNL